MGGQLSARVAVGASANPGGSVGVGVGVLVGVAVGVDVGIGVGVAVGKIGVRVGVAVATGSVGRQPISASATTARQSHQRQERSLWRRGITLEGR